VVFLESGKGLMGSGTAPERPLAAFGRGEWTEAYASLTAANEEQGLGPAGLQVLAETAYLLGRDEESVDALERAHRLLVEEGAPGSAATCAFWLGVTLLSGGEPARAAGWFNRQRRLLAETPPDSVDHGYGFLASGLRHQLLGRGTEALTDYRRAAEVGDRCGDIDLATLGRDGQGEVLVAMGEIENGLPLLDEAMVAVVADDVTPKTAGIVYCGVIEACLQAFDLNRAQEWTRTLARWCDEHPEMVPFRGQCLVRRSELMQLHAQWADAAEEATRACRWLTRPRVRPEAGMAFYQRAELHRLRGEWGDAEEAYRRAHESGGSPQPGLALLRLAQGKMDDALGMISAIGDETGNAASRHGVLAANVEIMLAAGNVAEARAAAEELGELARRVDRPLLNAVSSYATGAVLLAEGDTKGAVQALHRSRTIWRQLEAPYEAVRSGVLLAQALQKLGDTATAHLELESARRVFTDLGARPDLAFLDRLSTGIEGKLTVRERQVLAGVVEGKTNREIADDLFISVHTVRRHLQNIFPKLGVTSRVAAAAYAIRHDLV
jgi:DNA-binding CsgD family transcriptional regulator/tetratricopeptide (TPR) repeat protein